MGSASYDARHCPKPFAHSNSFSSYHNPLGMHCHHYPHLTDKETEAHTGQYLAQLHWVGKCKARTILCIWLLPCCLYGFERHLWLRRVYIQSEGCFINAFSSGHFPLYLHFVTCLFLTETVIREPLRKLDELDIPHSFLFTRTLHY